MHHDSFSVVVITNLDTSPCVEYRSVEVNIDLNFKKMSLYPSLEDMKVDQMAQVNRLF